MSKPKDPLYPTTNPLKEFECYGQPPAVCKTCGGNRIVTYRIPSLAMPGDPCPDCQPPAEPKEALVGVKRYRWHDDGMWCLEPGEVPPTAQWVKASDYDALALHWEQRYEAVRAQRDAAQARAEAMERKLAKRERCCDAIIQQNGFVLVRAMHLTERGLTLRYVDSIPPTAGGRDV